MYLKNELVVADYFINLFIALLVQALYAKHDSVAVGGKTVENVSEFAAKDPALATIEQD